MKSPITILAYFILAGVFFVSCGGLNQNYYEKKFEGSKTDSGECFEKYLQYDGISIASGEYAIYYGSDQNVKYIERDLIVQEATTKWVKKKTDRNCLSADPNDCLVWCQVIVPQQEEKIKILLETSQTEEFEWRRLSASDLVSTEGFYHEIEVLCPEHIDEEKIERIQHSLRLKGYDPGKPSKILTKTTLSALEDFQERNDLPVGLLDAETFDVLGLTDIWNETSDY